MPVKKSHPATGRYSPEKAKPEQWQDDRFKENG